MATALTQTTLSGAITNNQTTFTVASTTNILAPVNNVFQKIYVIGPGQGRGELMTVIGVPVAGTVQVSRLDEYKAAWPSGSVVLIGILSNLFESFQTFDPPGAQASNLSSSVNAVQVTPWVNIINGNQWLWSSVLNCWVPGWQNTSPQVAVTAAVASVAGTITPSGPLFHITGTNAITGFVTPVGFALGSFSVIPDAIFTWTTGDGSIGLAGTAVVNKLLTFTYDSSVSKWMPSYIA